MKVGNQVWLWQRETRQVALAGNVVIEIQTQVSWWIRIINIHDSISSLLIWLNQFNEPYVFNHGGFQSAGMVIVSCDNVICNVQLNLVGAAGLFHTDISAIRNAALRLNNQIVNLSITETSVEAAQQKTWVGSLLFSLRSITQIEAHACPFPIEGRIWVFRLIVRLIFHFTLLNWKASPTPTA